jgi:cobalt-zinc-cadmium efflux system outer membrane protein
MKNLMSSLVLVCASIAPANAGDSITLDAALARTAQRPQLKLAQFDVTAAQEARNVAGTALYNPVLSVEAGPQFGGVPTSPLVSIGIDQTIERGGKRDARRQTAASYQQLAQATFTDDARRARTATWQAFEHALIAKQRMAVLLQVEQFTRQLLETARKAQTAGGVTQLRINTLLAEQGRARQARAMGELDVQRSNAALADAIGANADEELDPTGELAAVVTAPPIAPPIAPPNAPPNAPPAAVSTPHSTLAVASATIEVANAEQRSADADAVVDITIGLGYAYQAAPDSQHAITARLSIPLGLRNHNERARAHARRLTQRAELTRDIIGIELARRTQTAQQNVATAAAAVIGFDQTVTTKLSDNLALAQDAFARGAIDFVELTMTQRDLVAARLAQLDAYASWVDAWAAWLDATGAAVQP